MKTFKLILLIAFIAVGFSSKAQPNVTVDWNDPGYTGLYEVELYLIDTYVPASYLVASEKNLPYLPSYVDFMNIDLSGIVIEDSHDLRYRYYAIVKRQGTSVYQTGYTGLLDSSETRFFWGTIPVNFQDTICSIRTLNPLKRSREYKLTDFPCSLL